MILLHYYLLSAFRVHQAAAKREKLAFEKQLREKDKAYKELEKEKQENEGNQAEVFEKAKLAGKLQEEVMALRVKADELVTTTKELDELKETHIMVSVVIPIAHFSICT